MRHSSGKEPKVALSHVTDKALAALVHCRDSGIAVQHDGPFRLNVPVQLADATGSEPHLHAGDILRNGQLAHGNLSGPTFVFHVFPSAAHAPPIVAIVINRQSRLVNPGRVSINTNSSSQSSTASLTCSGPNSSVTALINAPGSRSGMVI